MYASDLYRAAPKLQRASGELVVAVKRNGAASALEDLRQVGCLKARFPRHAVDGWLEIVVLNTSGGVACGDRLATEFQVRPAARAVIATQAAERFYRALPGSKPASVRNRIRVDSGACVDWLPQETLLFDQCIVERRLDVELADDAQFLGLETLVFGRVAMNERVAQAWLRDSIRVRRDGRWLLHETVRLDGAVDAALHRPAIAAGARALATLVFVAPYAESALTDARAAVEGAAAEAGISAWNGMLVARFLGATAADLRAAVIRVLAVLRGPRPLPRVWLC